MEMLKSKKKSHFNYSNLRLRPSVMAHTARPRLRGAAAAVRARACACARPDAAAPVLPFHRRSWNLFGPNVDQGLMMAQMALIANRSRTVDGVATSLSDIGYDDVGLDDNWQACGSYGPNGDSFHDANGRPVVNQQRFPDFMAMTNFAHSLGLTAGWYGNNCICSDHCSSLDCYQGDVDAVMDYGFDSIKLDGCGAQTDLTLYADLFNKTGKSILIENCHWGGTVPNATW